MARRAFHGVTEEQEVVAAWQTRDIRSPLRKCLDWLREPNSGFLLAVLLLAGAWLMPSLLPLLVPAMAGLVLLAATSREEAPLKLPIQSGLPDPNEPDPATRRPTAARGIFLLGNEMATGKELWLTNSDCRQHFLVLGTTGAGKTEALLGFGANALSWSSGFLFCDGKGDVALLAKVYAMLRRFGREDDLLVLNFMNDAQSVVPGRLNTNSINPFATGSADELTQMMVSLMDEVGGDGAMWKGRAVAMLTGVMRALVEKRDRGMLDLNVGEIRRHLVLSEIERLAGEKDLSPPTIEALTAYLRSLPGYRSPEEVRKSGKEDKGQSQTTLDQHGYLQMQFTKILGSLTDVYGHIFSTPFGEVDIADVVLNRRVLVIMLPALKKSGDEINNLGKIVVANLKGMMGNVLGSTIEGRYEDIVEKRVTNAPSPFICVLDEVGYYTVDGMAVMAAQARSLGFSLVFASQDIPAMKRRNEKEADSIIANTNVKIIMRLEDPGATAKLAIDRGDKALRARVSGFNRNMGLGSASYVDNTNANLEEASRISLRDLAAQREGEMHVLFQDRVIRARSFYANPEGAIDTRTLRPRPNHFIRVPRPSSGKHRAAEEVEAVLAALFAEGRARDAPPPPGFPSPHVEEAVRLLTGSGGGGMGPSAQRTAAVALAHLAFAEGGGEAPEPRSPVPHAIHLHGEGGEDIVLSGGIPETLKEAVLAADGASEGGAGRPGEAWRRDGAMAGDMAAELGTLDRLDEVLAGAPGAASAAGAELAAGEVMENLLLFGEEDEDWDGEA